MKHVASQPRRLRGFSLIEVMIAVVVLATGLLALAALQARLTQSSAEAKVRSRVAALLTARMDELRAEQYDGAETLPDDGCAVDLGADDWVPASFCTDTGIGALTATQEVVTWSSAVGSASFTEGRAPAVSGEPEFKRVTLTATWRDSDDPGNRNPHRLTMRSDFSTLGLRDSLLPPPPGSSTPTGGPIVRTEDPSGPGVIPIAVGGGRETAASNPRPEILGRNNNQAVVGTRFDVLTYRSASGEAVIQRRVETSAIRCQCRYGAGGDNLPEIYRAAQWPAVWTGERYEIFKPDSSSSAPGQSFASGPESNVEQSPLCQECCRDHHDNTSTGVAKFDPERVIVLGQAHGHYYVDNQGALRPVPNTNNASYLEACRLIRVDGFWRTAADMYSRHFGLLATESVGGVPAKTGVPASSAVTAYQRFVKDYLSLYDGSAATAPAGANALFDESARGLNNPASITIAKPLPKDERYLHGRALYVDYLEPAARDKIQRVRDNCPGGQDVTECMLPFLPFTTVNVTELAFWKAMVGDADNNSVISVTSGSSLIYDPVQPARGRTNALASATNGASADAVASIGKSSAGAAISPGVDPDDRSTQSDRQPFVVGSGTVTGGKFSVRLMGLPQTSDVNTANDPAVAWVTDNVNCPPTIFVDNKKNTPDDTDPNDYTCNTVSTPPGAGVLALANYFREYTTSRSHTATCSGGITVTETVATPTFDDFAVSSVTGGGAATWTVTNGGRKSEVTSVALTLVPNDGLVTVTFGSPTVSYATIASCTATRENENSPWQFASITWNKPWE